MDAAVTGALAAVRAARAGGALSREHVEALLALDPEGAEAAGVLDAAREVGMRACGGRGFVFSQIGVDDTPCPAGCAFCSFAGAGGDAGDGAAHLVPAERVVHYARLLSQAGVALVSLMATAAVDFDWYLRLTSDVRAAIAPGCLLMVNVGDLPASAFAELAAAGADAAYHARRLGEGELTRIAPTVRERTIERIHDAGLRLMTGVEPLWQGAPAPQVAERICAVPEYRPFAMGACAYTPVEGGAMGGRQPASRATVRYVAALVRLACGQDVPVGGIGGVAWVDAGCDPRNRGYGAADDELLADIDRARARLAQAGFTVEGPPALAV